MAAFFGQDRAARLNGRANTVSISRCPPLQHLDYLARLKDSA
jgi:hypothetical protein